ncbi:hypothetical protein ACQ4XT_16995 [Halobacillus faecis]
MDDLELQILMKKYLKQWMVRKLEEVKEGDTGKSFMFLDGETIHMLFIMMMFHQGHSWNKPVASAPLDDEKWESLMEEQEKKLKDILDLLEE